MQRISYDNNLLGYFSYGDLYQFSGIKNIYLKASVISSNVFKYRYDKAGQPYYDHLLRVADRLTDQKEKTAAILHDIFEDTEITEKDLLEMGIPSDVIEIIKIVTNENIDDINLTREEKLQIYSNKIDTIIKSGNIHAIRVKEADMLDNFDSERLKKLPEQQQEWLKEKYGKQLIKLKKENKGTEI